MKSANNRNVDVLVIGAGMAGLSAAAALQKAGRNAVVIDKGRAWEVAWRHGESVRPRLITERSSSRHVTHYLVM